MGRFKAHQPGTFPWREASWTVELVLRIVEIPLAQRFIPASVDQDFRAVFIITGGQGAGHAVRIVRINHAKSKAVAFCLMLFGIAVEVFPQNGRKDKFRVDHRLQQVGDGWTTLGIQRRDIPQGKISLQIEIAAEADQHNALAMLGQEMFPINDFWVIRAHILRIGHVVTQLIQGLHNNAESFSAVMAL